MRAPPSTRGDTWSVRPRAERPRRTTAAALLGLAWAVSLVSPAVAWASPEDDAPGERASETTIEPAGVAAEQPPSAPPAPIVVKRDPKPPARTPSQTLADAQRMVRGFESELMRLLDRVDASSVSLLGCEGKRRTDEFLITGAGSGVVVRYRGVHLITNAHVVRGCTRIKAVLADGTRVPLTLRAFDRSSDLAVLRFDRVPETVRPVPLDRRPVDAIEEGSWVVATGNPFLLAIDGRSVATLGVFSGMREASEGYNLATCCIQHDAEINPGNSGGPLWSLSGELVGVNGAIVTRSNQSGGGPAYSGASFSVPAEQVRRFIDTILGPAPRGRQTPPSPTEPARPAGTAALSRAAQRLLGLDLANSVSRGGERLGAFIRDVGSASPVTGFGAGDRITGVRFGRRAFVIRSISDLTYALGQHAAQGGGELTLEGLRAGAPVAWTGSLGS